MKLTIRGLVPEDRAAFRALMRERPGYTDRDAERRTQLVWHIAFQNPVQDGLPTYFVTTDGDRILCHMARMPTLFQIGRERHLAAFAHDLFAHPELQQTGAGFFATMRHYKKMEEACASFACLVWTNDINTKLQQSRKYTQAWVKRWARPIDVTPQLARRLPEGALLRAAGRLGTLALRGFDRGVGALLGRARVVELRAADERFDLLAERVGPKLGIAPVKSRAYVDWKYFRWPNVDVTVLGAVRGEELRGFVVLRNTRRADEPGRILDLVCDPDDEAASASLVRAALGHYRQQGAKTVECMATYPPLQRALARFLFREREPAFPFFFLNDHKYADRDKLIDPAGWSHAFGDSEGGEVP